ncbi:PIN-like domain-containing protein [Xanthomonas sp. SI]|uniref:PIN-like domain-containing protein n=1 Tax=Xanthomonas sp. SI TaxID=2724123 RepID=UPI00163AE9CD|nr:PIN-like domain-containing protein [Xanthomonas sp. SI]QNH14328.1 hypothetical protein HEP75_03797 [Xanthomonas sp. SI]
MPSVDHLSEIENVLDRRVPIAAVEMLAAAVVYKKKAEFKLGDIAIGLDANVLLKLAGHKQRADIIDYFSGKHDAPLVLPGQVIQEFWNNQFAAMQSVPAQVKKHFDALAAEIQKVDGAFGDTAVKAHSLLGELGSDYGYIRDKSTISHLASVCAILSDKAHVGYVPRLRFQEIAHQRRRTRTPPGFKDDADGDFFVWADFLFGLLTKKSEGAEFKHVVLVTDDKKLDWSLAGVAHPILAAEVLALTGVSFEVWSLDVLGKEVVAAVGVSSNATPPSSPGASTGEVDASE